MFMASVGLAFGMLAGAEAKGAVDAKEKAVAQEQWNAENAARDQAGQMRLVASIPDGYTSQGTPVVEQPELVLRQHPTRPTGPLWQAHHEHTHKRNRNGLFGGIALFLMGASTINRLAARRRRYEASTPIPHTYTTSSPASDISLLEEMLEEPWTPHRDTQNHTLRAVHEAALPEPEAVRPADEEQFFLASIAMPRNRPLQDSAPPIAVTIGAAESGNIITLPLRPAVPADACAA